MMYMTVMLVLLTTVTGHTMKLHESRNDRPIIGVMAQESDSDNQHLGDTYIPAAYFKYLEMGGARAVPVFVKRDEEYYDKVFNSINGVLFPGGGVNLLTSEYAKAAKIFFDKAVKANEKGDYFPIWGTCMGFQLLTAMTTRKDLLTAFDAEDLPLPLNFSSDFQSSRLFNDLPSDVYQLLLKRDVTENFHHYGLDPFIFYTTKALNKFYKVLSTNKDRNGKVFVSTMEALDYPIYGTQWHPEKPNFQWSTSYNINHDSDAIRVAQYFADFFVAEEAAPNVLQKMEHAIVNDSLSIEVVDQCLICLKEEWMNKVKVMFKFTKAGGGRSEDDTKNLLKIVGATDDDKPLLSYWMRGLSDQYKKHILSASRQHSM